MQCSPVQSSAVPCRAVPCVVTWVGCHATHRATPPMLAQLTPNWSATTATPPATTRAQPAPECPPLHPYAPQEGIVDATMLAKAGLNRMNLGHEITAVLEWDTCLPAVAQVSARARARARAHVVAKPNPNPNPNPCPRWRRARSASRSATRTKRWRGISARSTTRRPSRRLAASAPSSPRSMATAARPSPGRRRYVAWA